MSKIENWRDVVKYCDSPGLRYLAKGWGKGDQLALAKKVISRHQLRIRLILSIIIVWVVVEEFFYYGLHLQIGSPAYFLAFLVAGLGTIVAAATMTVFTYGSLRDGDFAECFMKFCVAYDMGPGEVANKEPDELLKFVNAKLVVRAMDMRKLERDCARIPVEHWQRKRHSFAGQIEKLYDTALLFDLVHGGYGPYYAQADEQLKAA